MDTKSIDNYIYTLDGTTLSQISQLQKSVAHSPTEIEYLGVTDTRR